MKINNIIKQIFNNIIKVGNNIINLKNSNLNWSEISYIRKSIIVIHIKNRIKASFFDIFFL